MKEDKILFEVILRLLHVLNWTSVLFQHHGSSTVNITNDRASLHQDDYKNRKVVFFVR